ncbi:Bypass of stop codon protein 6 [Trametes pubescens]|uniref:Bypass of stop codon protein 6 n=1 Tax=Trametes pubescens TaxID=154538 RepID=A0A1M2VIV6_TRAPU|nr:Bypass of stop codon protein 6 [Trametes pubescens]
MPAAGPSSASPRPSVDIAVFDEHDMDTFPHPAEKGTLRAFSSSALELPETYSASSLELPHTLTSERIRRRSELSRFRPLDSPPAVEPESIELPVIQEYSESGGKKQLDFRETAIPSRDNDVEIAPSFPSSLAPSIRLDEDTDSTAPAISAAQKAVYRRKHAIHFATLCFTIFLNGWNDGTTGPLLPRIQSYYHVSWRRHSSVLQIAAYAIMIPGGPFELMCLSFVIIGFGLSLQNSHANGFVASGRNHVSTKICLLHATYGFGALVAPLISTQFAEQKHWSFHYMISCALYILNTTMIWFVFRGRRQDEIKAEVDDLTIDPNAVDSNKYKQIFGIREVHFLSVFALIYVGTEVTIGSWSVSYVQEKRHGTANSGYISSGFFGGLMLGRIVLMWLNRKIGERRALFLYALLAIQLEVTVWVVPSLIENAIAVAFVGLLLGPMYPILVNHSTKILPRWLLTGCMGYIAGVGQAGSAVLPFITGLLASRFGIASLQPFIVSMMSTMIVIWALIPRVRQVPT